jgi:DEAD/DEAH box helicase domain-containing protein
VRGQARLLLTNPDMLHVSILPAHNRWADFFANLRFVVVDEIHTYRGVFGSHVANVLRRLRRIAAHYGAAPRFLLTSATIANPAELAERLVEAPVALVDQDGSSHGPRHFLIYNPPLIEPQLGLRRSVLQEAIRLAGDLLHNEIQIILFGRSRRAVEVIYRYLQDETSQAVRSYRSGYLPGERREIERGLRSGSVRAVVATNALELGIDIGGMGAALLAGYPGSIAAAWQQAGRAGRGDDPALVVLLASANPLDQFIAHHPEYFFGRSPEAALVNPDHLLILLNHVQCAAYELPFQAGEAFGRYPAGRLLELLDYLASTGLLRPSNGRYYWASPEAPTRQVSLRSASPQRILIQQEGQTIGEVDLPSACWMLHPGAIYLHAGQSFLVDHLDLHSQVAAVRPVDTDYYTEPQTDTTVQLLNRLDQSMPPGAVAAYGEIQVTSQVTAFRKVQWYTHQTLGFGQVDLPPDVLLTTGYWLSLLPGTVDALRAEGLWRSDPNQYGPNWEKQRQLARARDQFRCQVCGLIEQGRSHDVHHKVPFRTFTSYLEANQLANLVTLCPACHRRVETAVRIRSGLSGLAFVLGNLAPLFLMCDSADLGVHADPESPLADGAPSVVLYDRVPAGIGFSQRLFHIHPELIQAARRLVSACECQDGCPSCVGPGGEMGLGAKRETLAILEKLASENALGNPEAL